MKFNLSFLLLTIALTPSLSAAATGGFRTGRVELKSAGQLAFAPNGVLPIGDSRAFS